VSLRRVSDRRVSGCYALVVLTLASVALVAGCGGGGGGSAPPPPPPPPPFTSVTQVRVSQLSTFSAGCDGVAATGTLYTNTAAEPHVVLNPLSPSNLIAAWQQNRWSDGGSQGLNLAASFDGGMTWTLTNAAFSRCTGGNTANGGDYARASDVWLTFSSGAAYALSLSFTGGVLQPGSSSAMLVSRSADGGMTWSAPTALIKDGATAFNDKGSITADPNNASYVYAVWDRLTGATGGPSYFAVTTDSGSTWQPAGSIYDPGPQNQTLGNQIVVLPVTDVLVDILTEIDNTGGASTSQLRAVRSPDHGTHWSAPVTISSLTAVGTSDPHTGAAVRDGSGIASMSVSPGGVIYVVWQDSRFSSGQRDGIAMTKSTDGGLTWSTPIEVNADHNVQAFTPTIHVRADGVIGVSYYDLRNAGFSSTSLLTDCWLVTSSDGVNFRETHLSGPFDLRLAPNAQGLFLGDYEALTATATAFVPFYVQTDAGTAVASDAFISFPPATAAGAGAAGAVARFEARPTPSGATLTPEARRRVAERLKLVLAQRRNRAG
jgi:BNR repeat-like domain